MAAKTVTAKFPCTIHTGKGEVAPGTPVKVTQEEFDSISAVLGGEIVSDKPAKPAADPKAAEKAAADQAVADAKAALAAAVEASEKAGDDGAEAALAAMEDAEAALVAAEAARAALDA